MMRKNITIFAILLVAAAASAFANRPQAILGPGMGSASFRVPYHEMTNRVLSRDTTYILTGWYFIDSTYSITIPAGTLIRGDSASGGSLIIKRGAQIHAVGTPECPIVMTSNKPAGTRVPGDWGGPILLGRAPCDFGEATSVQIEGGFGSFPNTDALYGGTDPDDNSGEFEYVRIEFAGIAFSQDNEINGLTLGGVGRGTKLDHIQVSFSNDDDVEMFGGSVDLKFYVGWRMLDDDIDTDQGYSGRIQFAYEKRDPAIFDASAPGSSEGYESDGESPQFTLTGGGPFNHQPHTSYHASNVTIVGPQSDTGMSVNPKFTVLARLRRACRIGIYNNIMVAYPMGVDVRDTASQRYAAQDSLQIRNTSIQSKIKQIFEDSSPNTGNIAGFNVNDWFNGDNGYANWNNIGGRAARQPVDVGLRPEVFNLDWSNNPVPLVGSEADTAGTNFQFANGDPFFDSVSYRGAFDPHVPRNQQWDWGWTNYDPQNYDPEATVGSVPYLVADDWNMISLPFKQVDDPSVTALYPATSGTAYQYTGSYSTVGSLTHGPGYWLKFLGMQAGTIIGCTSLIDTVAVRNGWNLIGSVSDTVPVVSVSAQGTTVISNYFGYSGGYFVADNILPGQAYWVKTSSAGSLVLDGVSTPKPKTSLANSIALGKMTAITIADKAGHSQTLYCDRAATSQAQEAGLYDLPPLPPAGAFDVRYANQRFVSSIGAGTGGQAVIQIQGSAFPMSLKLSNLFAGARVTITEMGGDNAMQQHIVTQNGSIRLTDARTTSLKLEFAIDQVPAQFGLSEGYPNPFNPTTRITVDVPHDASVDIAIYNLEGQKIRTLAAGMTAAGSHTIEWNGLNDNGIAMPSGTYFVQMHSEGFSAVRKLLMMK
jgi:hypothetical protein